MSLQIQGVPQGSVNIVHRQSTNYTVDLRLSNRSEIVSHYYRVSKQS